VPNLHDAAGQGASAFATVTVVVVLAVVSVAVVSVAVVFVTVVIGTVVIVVVLTQMANPVGHSNEFSSANPTQIVVSMVLAHWPDVPDSQLLQSKIFGTGAIVVVVSVDVAVTTSPSHGTVPSGH
jgi:hypothetical protein